MGDTDISMSLDNEEQSDIDMMDSSDIAHHIGGQQQQSSSFKPRQEDFIPSPAFQSSPVHTPSQLRYANARKINNKDPPYMEFFEKQNERRMKDKDDDDGTETPAKSSPTNHHHHQSPLQHIISAAKTAISSPGRLGAKLGKASRDNTIQHIDHDNNNNTLLWERPLNYENQMITSQGGWFARHETPVILTSYLHVFMRLVYVLVITYIILSCIYMIHRDVSRRIDKQIQQVVFNAKKCTKDYIENRCMQERIPANIKLCQELEECRITNEKTIQLLEKDTYESISRSKMLAETYASILDSFVNGISYKTMLFILLLLYGCIFASNFTFGFLQARWAPGGANQQQQQQQLYPSTPARPPNNNNNNIDWSHHNNNNDNNNNNHYSGSLYSMGGTPIPAMARINNNDNENPDSMILSRRNFVK